jgi:hypothetical protein
MESLTFLLTAPGAFLAALLPSAAGEGADEAIAEMSVTLGIVFWVVVAVLVRIAIHLARRPRGAPAGRLETAGRAGFAHAEDRARAGVRRLQRAARRWTWPEALGAAWRMQAIHLVIYAVLPLLWAGANLGWFAVTFPLRILGPGSAGWYDGALDHMKHPACWTFVTPCSGPQVTPGANAFFIGRPSCPPGRGCTVPEPTPLERTAWAWFWKAIWLVASVVWIGAWRNGRVTVGKIRKRS